MHKEADRFVAECANLILPERGLDVGGRNVNGSCRSHFLGCSWTGVDIMPGPGVDIVDNFATWLPISRYDLVLCTEVFEHTPDWRAMIDKAFECLVPGGYFIVTAATDPRTPHSAIDGGALRGGEYYRNVNAWYFANELMQRFAIERFVINRLSPRGSVSGWGDVYAMACRP